MNTETHTLDLPTLKDEAGQGAALLPGQVALPFLGQLKVRLSADLGQTELTVAELTALKAGATVSLDRLLSQPIDLLAEGHVVAQGTLVAVGEHFGLRITTAPKLG